MIDILKVQAFLRSSGIDGWLFTDHHGRDPVATQILGDEVAKHATRRWYYLIPANGEPLKLAHQIEPHRLKHLPGIERTYSRWSEQFDGVSALCDGRRRVAMQVSENGALLLLSNADAGVVDLVRRTGVEVVSSGDLLQGLLTVFTSEQIELHREAGRRVDLIRQEAFAEVRRGEKLPREAELRRFILRRFEESGLVTEDGPVVAAGPNSGDPHYEPHLAGDRQIGEGDVLLLDMWAKLANEPVAPYYDITWVATLGQPHDERVEQVFHHVSRARDAAISFVRDRVSQGQTVRGFEVDQAARQVIEEARFGPYFIHRTGHSIGTSVHGLGANMDDFECRDERAILSGSCFSIEPGIYLPEFGIRLEVDMLVEGTIATVTGEIQDRLIIL